jgi:hypothetical protein
MKQMQVHIILHYLGPNLAWHCLLLLPAPLCGFSFYYGMAQYHLYTSKA